MWKAIYEGTHKDCIIGPLCKKYNITDLIYLINAWVESQYFYYSETHILQGKEEDKKKYISALKNHKTTKKLEQSGNLIITLSKREAELANYIPLWDKRIIQTKPMIQKPDGTERWEFAAWDKKVLTEVTGIFKKGDTIKLKSITKSKINELFIPHITPNFSQKQKQAIELAIKRKYFEFPRKTNLDQLAKEMKITKQTYRQHLRTAEKKLVPFLVENTLN